MFEQEQVASYVSVKLSNNAFNPDNYVVRVPRDTVSVNGIVSEIAAGYPSIDPYVILHSLELVKAKTLELLQQGRAVDVMELGTMYLKPTGTVTRDNPQVTDLPSLTLQFTPSAAAKEAIAEVSSNSFMINDSAPEIQTVYDYATMTEGQLTPSSVVRVTGAKMKVAVDESGYYLTDNGVWFVPPDTNGDPNMDEGSWIKAGESGLITNYPKKLEFYTPSGIATGTSYYICIRSTYLGKDSYRKTYVQGISPSAYAVVT